MNRAARRIQGAARRVQGAVTRVTERLQTIQENELGTEITKNSKINYTEGLSHTTMTMRSRILFAVKTEMTKL